MDETIDLGRKSGIAEVAAPDKESKKYYPSMSVPLDMVKDKFVGDMCRFEFIVKITGISEREDGGDANIEVRSAKYLGKAGRSTRQEYAKMSDDERDAYDKRMLETGEMKDVEENE